MTIAIRGLASDSVGRKSPVLNFYRILLVAPDSSSPCACRFTRLVWSRTACGERRGKTHGHAKSHSFPLTLSGIFHGY